MLSWPCWALEVAFVHLSLGLAWAWLEEKIHIPHRLGRNRYIVDIRAWFRHTSRVLFCVSVQFKSIGYLEKAAGTHLQVKQPLLVLCVQALTLTALDRGRAVRPGSFTMA